MNRLAARVSPVPMLAAVLSVGFATASMAQEMDQETKKSPAAIQVATAAASTDAAAKNASTDSGVRKMICLNMTLQCFAARPSGSSVPSLDLSPPDIRTLVSEAELTKPLPDPYEEMDEQATVEVEGTRPEVYVPGGLASLAWAVRNPTQAWRILLPVPSSQAK